MSPKYVDKLQDRLAFAYDAGGGRVVRWCWVNFQCPGVLLIWIPFDGLPVPDLTTHKRDKPRPMQLKSCSEESVWSSSESSSSDESYQETRQQVNQNNRLTSFPKVAENR